MFSVYYFTATTVHPWYISILLIISVFTGYLYPIIWSVIVYLSYTTYSNQLYTENLLIVFIEYLIIYAVFIYEVIFYKNGLINKFNF